MIERFHKGRLRSDVQLGQELKREARGLIPRMYRFYRGSGIYYAVVQLVGSAVRGLADQKSDYDYFIDSRRQDYSSVSRLVVVTFENVRPGIKRLTSHPIGLHFPETSVFDDAIHNNGYTREVVI